jgi:hypothetical protein
MLVVGWMWNIMGRSYSSFMAMKQIYLIVLKNLTALMLNRSCLDNHTPNPHHSSQKIKPKPQNRIATKPR